MIYFKTHMALKGGGKQGGKVRVLEFGGQNFYPKVKRRF
jgi:hypothetical protein